MSMPFYQPSCRIGLAALPWCALFIILLPAAALGYAFGLLATPFWFHPVAFIITLTLACAAVSALVHKGRVRHPRFMRNTVTLLALAFLYCHWLAYEALGRAPDAPVSLSANPVDLVRAWWSPPEAWRFSLLGHELPWLLLCALWICEGMLLVWSARIAASSIASEPFCETTQSWCEKNVLERRFAALPDLPGLAHRIGAHPRRLLDELMPSGTDDPAVYARLTVYSSPASCYVTIDNMRRTRQGRRVSESSHATLEYLALPGMTPQELMMLEKDTARPIEAADPIELVTAIADFQAGRFAAALVAATAHRMAEQHHLRCDALRLCGLASAHLERWEESLGHWQALFLDQPGAMTALQAATAAVMAGHLSVGATWLAQARELNRQAPEMRDIEMLDSYLAALERARCFAAGVPYMDEIKACFTLAGITDATFLHVRGMPTLGMFLSRSAIFVLPSLEGSQARAWYEDMRASLDEPGRKTLAAWMEQHLLPLPISG